MKKMKFFIDTHDRQTNTFPEHLSSEEFAIFYRKYEEALREQGAVNLRIHVGFEEGRAFCFNMAPDADAVRRAHEKIGLPFTSITEVTTATPGDIFFAADG